MPISHIRCVYRSLHTENSESRRVLVDEPTIAQVGRQAWFAFLNHDDTVLSRLLVPSLSPGRPRQRYYLTPSLRSSTTPRAQMNASGPTRRCSPNWGYYAASPSRLWRARWTSALRPARDAREVLKEMASDREEDILRGSSPLRLGRSPSYLPTIASL